MPGTCLAISSVAVRGATPAGVAGADGARLPFLARLAPDGFATGGFATGDFAADGFARGTVRSDVVRAARGAAGLRAAVRVAAGADEVSASALASVASAASACVVVDGVAPVASVVAVGSAAGPRG